MGVMCWIGVWEAMLVGKAASATMIICTIIYSAQAKVMEVFCLGCLAKYARNQQEMEGELVFEINLKLMLQIMSNLNKKWNSN